MKISDREIGSSNKAFVIAEIAQAHDGSLGLAHKYIDAVASAGADAVKFQTHIADEESTLDDAFRINFSYHDKNRYEYWKRMEFSSQQWDNLSRHAEEKKIIFLSSPFSVKAVQLLNDIGVPAWKIGSGEVNNPLMLNKIASTGKPIILSTGMSKWDEINAAVKKINEYGSDFALLQCTSEYPTPLSDVGLNVIDDYRKHFKVPVGLSDHSGMIYPSLAAMSLGADIIEVHVTFHRAMFGPDVSSSVTLEELSLIIHARDAIHEMRSHPVDKDEMAMRLGGMRDLFNKSLALVRPGTRGTVLTREMITVKKPGTGIPADKLEKVIGARLARDVSNNRILCWDDIKGKDET
jgi:N,N'-diacetyllegionaminate synthase